jgi:hypothetical protein
MKTINKLLTVSALSTSLLTAGAFAANPSVTATITGNATFITPLAVTSVTAANFGKLPTTASSTYVLSTADVVTPANSVLSGTPAAGSFVLTASTNQSLSIVPSYSATAGGVTPSAATCKMGSASEVACSTLTAYTATTASTNVKVGMSIGVGGTAMTDGASVTPSVTLTIAYN